MKKQGIRKGRFIFLAAVAIVITGGIYVSELTDSRAAILPYCISSQSSVDNISIR